MKIWSKFAAALLAPLLLAAGSPALAANNVKKFVAYAQKHGADIKQDVGGIGGTSHMACLLFNKMFDLKPTLVIYRGAGPAMNDLVGGHIDYFCEQAVSIAPSATGDKVKGIIISTNERLAAMPDVPGAKEAGAPDFQLNVWSAVFAPKGTPKDIVGKLAAALDKTLDEPTTAEKLAKLGGTVPPKIDRGPDHLRKTVASDVPRWASILKEAAAATKSN